MTTILLIGYGNMGKALIEGWLKKNRSIQSITIISPNVKKDHSQPPLVFLNRPDELSDSFHPDVIFLAVKPQKMSDILGNYKKFSASLFVSIVAGKKISFFESFLSQSHPIIRTMPNTASAVQKGMTVAIANKTVTQAQKTLCHTLLKAIGEVAWIDNEDQMDVITSLSGSGPAYLFFITETLANIGIEFGLEEKFAKQLARQTVIGAGALLDKDSTDPEILRHHVTSPGGTTEAALTILKADLPSLLKKAMESAKKRSIELSQSL